MRSPFVAAVVLVAAACCCVQLIGVAAQPGTAVPGGATQTVFKENTHPVVLIPLNPSLKPVEHSLSSSHPINAAKHWLEMVERQHAQVSESSARDSDRFYAAYSAANMAANLRSANPFLDAFLHAYNNHEDVLIAADDVWLLVQLHFSAFVHSSADALKSVFVGGGGGVGSAPVDLEVTDPTAGRETDWPSFFTALSSQVRSHVKGPASAAVSSDFTTTDQIESILSSLVLVDTFQPFFRYTRVLPSCGIRNVLMIGEEDDWTHLKEKLVALQALVPGSSFDTEYAAPLLPVLDELVATYQGEPNVTYWNHMFNHKRGHRGSGETSAISGWFLRFFGKDPAVEVVPAELSLLSVHAPLRIVDEYARQEKKATLVGGFYGLAYDQSALTYRPVMSLSVIVDQRSIKRLKPKKKKPHTKPIDDPTNDQTDEL